MKNLWIGGLFGLLMVSCGSSNSGSGGTSNPMDSLANDVTNYMTSSAPSLSSESASYYERLIASTDWTDTQNGLKRLGLQGGADTSISQYTEDFFNASYKVDGDHAPHIFGRFSEEMFVLKTIGSQVPFSGGVPVAGTHSVTANTGEGEMTFDVVVEEIAGESDFDVTLSAAALNWKGVLRNNSQEANLASADGVGDGYGLTSRLFWNKNTGELKYDLISANFSGSNLDSIEVQRMYVKERGDTTLFAHIYNDNYLAVTTANGADSSELSLSFESTQTDTNINKTDFCVTVATGNAVDNLCGGLDHTDAGFLTALETDVDDLNSSEALHVQLFGASYADMSDTKLDFGTNQEDFLSKIGN